MNRSLWKQFSLITKPLIIDPWEDADPLSGSTEGEADSGEGSGVVAALQAARDCHQLLQEGRVLGMRAVVETSSGDVGTNSR